MLSYVTLLKCPNHYNLLVFSPYGSVTDLRTSTNEKIFHRLYVFDNQLLQAHLKPETIRMVSLCSDVIFVWVQFCWQAIIQVSIVLRQTWSFLKQIKRTHLQRNGITDNSEVCARNEYQTTWRRRLCVYTECIFLTTQSVAFNNNWVTVVTECGRCDDFGIIFVLEVLVVLLMSLHCEC